MSTLTGDSATVSGNTSEHTGVGVQDEDVKPILGSVPNIYWQPRCKTGCFCYLVCKVTNYQRIKLMNDVMIDYLTVHLDYLTYHRLTPHV